jgi:hypothetical protein
MILSVTVCSQRQNLDLLQEIERADQLPTCSLGTRDSLYCYRSRKNLSASGGPQPNNLFYAPGRFPYLEY